MIGKMVAIMIVTVMVIYDCHDGNGHNDCQDDGY